MLMRMAAKVRLHYKSLLWERPCVVLLLGPFLTRFVSDFHHPLLLFLTGQQCSLLKPHVKYALPKSRVSSPFLTPWKPSISLCPKSLPTSPGNLTLEFHLLALTHYKHRAEEAGNPQENSGSHKHRRQISSSLSTFIPLIYERFQG